MYPSWRRLYHRTNSGKGEGGAKSNRNGHLFETKSAKGTSLFAIIDLRDKAPMRVCCLTRPRAVAAAIAARCAHVISSLTTPSACTVTGAGTRVFSIGDPSEIHVRKKHCGKITLLDCVLRVTADNGQCVCATLCVTPTTIHIEYCVQDTAISVVHVRLRACGVCLLDTEARAAFHGRTRRARALDSAHAQEVFAPGSLPTGMASIAVHPSGTCMVLAQTPVDKLYVFDLPSFCLRRIMGTHGSSAPNELHGVRGVCFAPDGVLLVADENRRVVLWTIEDVVLRSFKTAMYPKCVTVCSGVAAFGDAAARGDVVAVGSESGVDIHALADGSVLHRLTNGFVIGVAESCFTSSRELMILDICGYIRIATIAREEQHARVLLQTLEKSHVLSVHACADDTLLVCTTTDIQVYSSTGELLNTIVVPALLSIHAACVHGAMLYVFVHSRLTFKRYVCIVK